MKPDFFLNVLKDTNSAIPVRAEAAIVEQWDGKFVVASSGMDVQEYSHLGCCKLQPIQIPRPLSRLFWGGDDDDQLHTSFDLVVWNVEFQSHEIHVVHLEWESSCGGSSRDWVIADTESTAREFVLDVERKTNATNDSILVFSNGYWDRSRSLFRSIQDASFDDLVLSSDMKESIRTDFKQFLDSEQRYKQLGIAWRRGALFILSLIHI